MDGGVTISPNVKRKHDTINVNGDKINLRTKEVIEPAEVPYKPTPEELASMAANKRPAGTPADALKPAEPGANAPLPPAVSSAQQDGSPKPPASNLAAQIKNMVNQAVQQALAELDIKGMVASAIKEAFKDISL